MDSANDSTGDGFAADFDAVAGLRPPTRYAGIAVYIGLDDATAAAAGTDVRRVAEAIAAVVDRLAPGAERQVTIVPAPAGGAGSSLEAVRRAAGSGPPSSGTVVSQPVSADHPVAPIRRLRSRPADVVIDVSRHRIIVDDRPIGVTFAEFELLRALVHGGGRALTREELLHAMPEAARPSSARAVDDLVRRLRGKLEPHDDVVRTVRGVGYRLHAHDGVQVLDGGGKAGSDPVGAQ
jgi:DNA-binding winged helix-turn-helix (wHTH) protein